jgi:ferredoxin
MAVAIDQSCVRCGACEWECPAEAITPGAHGPVVETEACTECYGFFGESQCIVACPVDAIVTQPEPASELERRFARNHPGRRPEDTWIWRRIGRPEEGQADT